MLNFVYNHDEEVARFVGQLAPPSGGGFGRCKTIGVIDETGQLIAGLVYFNYDPNAAVIEFGAAAIEPALVQPRHLPPHVRVPVRRVRLPDAVRAGARRQRAAARRAGAE